MKTACSIYNHVGLSLKEAHCSTFSKGDRENKYLSIQLLLLCFGSIPNLPTLKKTSWLQRWKIEKKIVSNVQIRQAIDRVVMNYSIILQSCFLGELERERVYFESQKEHNDVSRDTIRNVYKIWPLLSITKAQTLLYELFMTIQSIHWTVIFTLSSMHLSNN